MDRRIGWKTVTTASNGEVIEDAIDLLQLLPLENQSWCHHGATLGENIDKYIGKTWLTVGSMLDTCRYLRNPVPGRVTVGNYETL